MRALTAAQLAALQRQDYRVVPRIRIANGSGTLIDYTDWLIDASGTQDADANVEQVMLSFAREDGALSLAPFVAASALNEDDLGAQAPALDLVRLVIIETAQVPLGTDPVDSDYLEIYRGVLDRVDWPGRTNRIECKSRDMGALLQDRQVLGEPIFGFLDGSVSVENGIQALLDYTLGAGVVTLYVPVATGAALMPTEIAVGSLLEAARSIAGSIGWTLRYQYDAAGVSRLTLTEPDRAAAPGSEVWTFGPSDYADIPGLDINIDGVRTEITVTYRDRDTKERLTVTSTAPQSILDKYGLREGIVGEADESPIGTATQAQALADAIRTDTQEPRAEHEIETYWAPHIQIGDYLRFLANGVHYDSDQYGGVFGRRWELSRTRHRTRLLTRGKPAAAFRRWLHRDVPGGSLIRKVQGSPPTLEPRRAVNADRTAADVHVRVQSEAGEQIRLAVKDGEAAGASVWRLVVSGVDASPRWVASGTEIDGATAWFHDGSTFAQKLNGVALLRDQIRTVYLQVEGIATALKSTWVPLAIEVRGQPWLEGVDLVWDETADTLSLTATGGAHCQSGRWEISDDDFATIAQTTDLALADGQRVSWTRTLVELGGAAARGQVWKGRVVPFNGALSAGVCTGLAGVPETDSEEIPASESGVQPPTASIAPLDTLAFPTDETRQSLRFSGALGAGGTGALQWRYRIDHELTGEGAWTAPANATYPATADGWSTMPLPYDLTQSRNARWPLMAVLQVRDADQRQGESRQPIDPVMEGVGPIGRLRPDIPYDGRTEDPLYGIEGRRRTDTFYDTDARLRQVVDVVDPAGFVRRIGDGVRRGIEGLDPSAYHITRTAPLLYLAPNLPDISPSTGRVASLDGETAARVRGQALAPNQNLLGPTAGPEVSVFDDVFFYLLAPIETASLAPGSVVSVSVDARSELGSGNNQLFLQARTGDGNTILGTWSVQALSTTYTRLTIENVTIPASTGQLRVWVHRDVRGTGDAFRFRRAMLHRGPVALPFEEPPFRTQREDLDNVRDSVTRRRTSNEEATGGARGFEGLDSIGVIVKNAPLARIAPALPDINASDGRVATIASTPVATVRDEARTGRQWAGASGENWIANGGGQANNHGEAASSWSFDLGNSLLVDTANISAKVGDRVLWYNHSGAAARSRHHQSWQLTAGRYYEVSGWIYSSPTVTNASSFVGVNVYMSTGKLQLVEAIAPHQAIHADGFFIGQPADASRGWTEISAILECTTTGFVRVSTEAGFNQDFRGHAWFDAIRFREVNPYPVEGRRRVDTLYAGDQQLDAGVVVKEPSVALHIARGVKAGAVDNGDPVSFLPAFDRTPAVLFGLGGRTYKSSGLAGDQMVKARALNLDANGFTAQCLISEVQGALTARSASFVGTDANKGFAAEAYDSTYRYNYDVTVNAAPSGSLAGSTIELGFWTNDGSGWVLRATREYFNPESTALTYLAQYVDVTVGGMGLDDDFRITVDSTSGNGGSVTRNSVTWSEGTAPNAVASTGGGAGQIPYLAVAGT